MGPYDNETGNYIHDPDVMAAHWLVHDETDALYIIAREDDGFEGYGMDDDIEMQLFALPDATLADSEAMKAKGFSLIPDVLRRFDSGLGYHHA